MWGPLHSAKKGNEEADKPAKGTIQQNCIKMNIGSADVKMHVIGNRPLKGNIK